jgi:phosphatidylinositol-bisphosphatase
MLAPLREDDGGMRCDVLVVGLQEAPALDGFVELLLDALGGDDAFVHLASVSLEPGGWIRMDAFARRELLPLVRDVRRDAVSCGLGNVIGNKGAVGVSFEYAGARMCFLNAHLAAHAENVERRNADYHRIVKTMFAPRGRDEEKRKGFLKKAGKVKKNAVAPAPAFAEDAPSDSPIDSTRPTPSTPKFGGVFKRKGWSAADGFDVCVFLGDLNYRVEGNRRAVDVLLERGMLDVMRANDQLRIERNAGRAFAGWSEGALAFPPTYKVDRGTCDTYDTSKKQRVPSWTDRVMWRTAGGGAVTCPDGADVYTSAKGVLTSDHLPVVARIEARVRGARDAALGDGAHARPRARAGMCAVM